jgi:hypothetical protein
MAAASGQELLASLWTRGADPVGASVEATHPRYVLARTPEVAAQLRSREPVRSSTRLGSGELFELDPAQLPEPLDPLDATFARSSSNLLELVANRAGTLSVSRLDRCALRVESHFGPLAFVRKVKLQGSEFADARLRPGEVAFRHRVRRAIDAWPAPLRPRVVQALRCESEL